MPIHPRLARIALMALAMSISSAAASGGAAAAGPFKVTSSLDGKTVLPHRIRWIAHPGLPHKRVRKVEFLIDGRVRWVERNAPYVYGDDSDWLVSSWLTPQRHRFTVRVIDVRGRRATRQTTSRVTPTPAPPAELANSRWRHNLVNQGENGSPAGVWQIHIDDTGWKIDDPKGGTNYLDVAYLSPGLVELRGGIWTRPRSIHEGNGWCEDTNRSVRYRWTVVADKLNLALAGPKRCGDQATVLSGAGVPQSSGGTWTRVP